VTGKTSTEKVVHPSCRPTPTQRKDHWVQAQQGGRNQVRFALLDSLLSTASMSVTSVGNANASVHPSFEIKSAQLPLVALHLKRSAAGDLASAEVLKQFGPEGESPDFFDHDALVIDFLACGQRRSCHGLSSAAESFTDLQLDSRCGAQGGSPAWMHYALQVGLGGKAPPEVYRTLSR